ncbi:hypothetical protein [Streptomyces sp. SBT349]|uniref:hypothetical protein n=1 Tax=Streptomyces sp. SBT349 TaxID=1580539 RepID=UPI00066B60F7|nr:hypothetical protein [Streptomyces sp. SBT349]
MTTPVRSSTSAESWAAVSESMPSSPSGRSAGISSPATPSSSPISDDSHAPAGSVVPFLVVMASS